MMALRAIGVNKIQLYIGIFVVIINTTFNYLLIYGHFGFPELGVKGAAIATLIARTVEMCIYIGILIRNKYTFSLQIKELFHLDIQLIKSMISKAIPLTVNEIFFSLGLTLLFLSYVRCDESLISAISVVDTVMQIGYMIFGGLSSAISIMVGNRLGADLIDEAKDNANKLIVLGMMVGACIGLTFIVVAPYIANLYNVSDVIKQTIVTLLRIKSQ